MEVKVLNIKGEDTGRVVALNDSVFGIEPNDHAIYLDVRRYLAAQRQGTAKAKERSEMSGSTRKLGRQKGGGGARVFGPQPRDYSFKLNKKVKSLARRSALAYKAQENAIVVVEDFEMAEAKTKNFVEIMKNLKVEGQKVLVLMPGVNKNVVLSARNLERVKVSCAADLNTYGVLNAGVLLVTENALGQINEVLTK